MEVINETLHEKMEKTIDSLKHHFASVRTGRPNPELVTHLKVECYGQPMQMQQLASVHVQDGNSLVITPFDKSTIGDIERGIMKSDLGLTPTNNGANIRITIPPLTEERRKELDKVVKKMAEESRIGIRNIRRDFMDKAKKDDDLSEDEKKREEDEIQKITDEFVHEIDALLKDKEAEIMEI